MKCIIILLVVLASMPWIVSGDVVDVSEPGSFGHLPEFVVTAERFEHEDGGWVGMLDTIVVTAPRVRIYSARTTDKNPAGLNLMFATFVLLGAVCLSSFSWFMYRRYLQQRHQMQKCPC